MVDLVMGMVWDVMVSSCLVDLRMAFLIRDQWLGFGVLEDILERLGWMAGGV